MFERTNDTDTYTIPEQTFTAGNFTIGKVYTILTVGNTDYTLIGSASNDVGTSFTATGVGTGNGTATNKDEFTGDNTTTAFTANSDIENKIVLVGGEVQYLNSDYTVSGATVTFTSPPTTGASIQIKTGPDWKLISTITGTASTEFGYAVDCDESGNNIVIGAPGENTTYNNDCLLYTSPSPRD